VVAQLVAVAQLVVAQWAEDINMAETIIIKNMDRDLFMDGTLQVLDKFDDNEIKEIDNIVYKTSKITFAKEPDILVSDIIPSGQFVYVNTKILGPMDAKEPTLITAPAGTPTYAVEPYRNPRYSYLSSSVPQPETELSIDLFYVNKRDSVGRRNIIFSSDYTLVGTPFSDYKEYTFCNLINLTYSPTNKISQTIQYVDSVSGFNIYERFMALVGHYSDAIRTIDGENSSLTLESVVRNFDYPLLDEIYYTVANMSPLGIPEQLDLSYDPIQQEMFDQIRRSVSYNSLDYDAIFRGDESANELLFFKVEKWFTGVAEGAPDQVFFMPATSNGKFFVDTQILENRTYYYRITSYYTVIQHEYYFDDLKDLGTTGECTVYVSSTARIDNMIVFEGLLVNKPAPPLPPFVSFHSKASEQNKLKIYLELQKGSEKTRLIQFPGVESSIGSNFVLPNNQIEFQYNRSEAGRFEIYRLSEPPTTYQDFTGNLIGTFSNKDKTQNMVILDKVQPNKKYYYTFRSFDSYGSFSNPTPVYEVEMLKDADDVRVLMNSLLVSDGYEYPDVVTFEKYFRSLLGIKVASQQIEFNLEDVRDIDTNTIPTFKNQLDLVSLGGTGVNGGDLLEKIWGRKFKFRVRSNDSGKTIDFNIKVNLIKEESEEDFT